MTKHYDMLILGHISKDENITPDSRELSIGGAVVYSSVTAKRIGANLLALTKLNQNDQSALEIFSKHDVPYIYRNSRQSTSIRNTYFTPDRDKRKCEALGAADPFVIADIPDDVEADIYYLGGLMKGEFQEELIAQLAQRGKIATDAQGFLRVNENGPMVFKDWDRKREILPLVTYLKTDAAEAEILTGEKDAEKAARLLHSWGAQEVMVTSSPGVLVLAEEHIYFFPFTSKNLTGRTGRGDTCFSTYCYWRMHHSPKASCLLSAALTSLKMETPGPFSGELADVESAIVERYGLEKETIRDYTKPY
ncbi:MAG: PfkB family carbohydrate kinase [Candidatus Omnitrophota bacterium]